MGERWSGLCHGRLCGTPGLTSASMSDAALSPSTMTGEAALLGHFVRCSGALPADGEENTARGTGVARSGYIWVCPFYRWQAISELGVPVPIRRSGTRSSVRRLLRCGVCAAGALAAQ